MAYKGKYIDRSPNIRAEGKVFGPNAFAADSMKFYSDDEMLASIMRNKCKDEKIKQNLSNIAFLPCASEDSMKGILSPEVRKTRWTIFQEKFMEENFFKKHELGKSIPANSKPKEFTNENRTYGMKTPRSESISDLILPKRTVDQVNREYIDFHDKYVISHNHYLPSEQVNRRSTFGVPYNVDIAGRMVKKCLQHSTNEEIVSKAHKKFLNRTRSQLGQRLNRYELEINPNETLGKPCILDACDARDLLEDINPCHEVGTYTAIAYVHTVRHNLFKRDDFQMQDLKTYFRLYDDNNTGYLSLHDIISAMGDLLIHVNGDKLRLAVSAFNMFVDEGLPTERIEIEKFWRMVHIQYPLPHVDSIRSEMHNKDTTYRLFVKDREKSITPLLVPLQLKPNDDDFRTGVGDLISPGIPLQFGLGPSDFEILRSKEQLRQIFKRVLVDNFDTIWKVTRKKLKRDENCKISINELRKTIDEQATSSICQD
uniref:EF-hand domain-containing protein n=1 Tax=Glossina austeni TaxID=7395 RepID=A0A1A9VUZ3_GLOAU